jgi:hypothetical protein
VRGPLLGKLLGEFLGFRLPSDSPLVAKWTVAFMRMVPAKRGVQRFWDGVSYPAPAFMHHQSFCAGEVGYCHGFPFQNRSDVLELNAGHYGFGRAFHVAAEHFHKFFAGHFGKAFPFGFKWA